MSAAQGEVSGQSLEDDGHCDTSFSKAALAAACHNPLLKTVAKGMKEHEKLHKAVIIAIVRRLITIANAILKTGKVWRHQAG
jgi:transposase